MTTEIVKSSEIDGIVFYAGKNGERGVSKNGLARLCGVARSSMYQILDLLSGKYGEGKAIPKSLEHLKNNVFYQSVEGSDGAMVVTSETCTAIIFFFAYESKAKNDTALFSLKKFAQRGFDSWVTEITGYEEDKEDSLLDSVRQLITEVKELKTEVREYKQIRSTTTTIYTGMDYCLNSFVEQNLLDSSDNDITLAEWLETKGITLDKARMHKFANLVADTYRTMKQTEPRQAMIKATTGRGSSLRNVYNTSEFPILEVSLKRLF